MTALTHAVVGAGLASSQNNLLGGFAAAFLSHFVLDVLPHNDYIYALYKFDKKKGPYPSPISIILLILSSIFLAGSFSLKRDPAVIIGGLAGILPDFFTAVFGKTQIFKAFNQWHSRLHSHSSLAKILLERIGKTRIEKSRNWDEYINNYKIIAGLRTGRIGWILELAVELTLLVFFLSRIIF